MSNDSPESNINRDYYLQVQESIKSIYDLTTRVDERVLQLMKKQEELERKLDEQLKSDHNLDTRVANLERVRDERIPELDTVKNNLHRLEIEMQAVKITQGGQEGRWKTIVSFVVQIAWVILAAWLLMKMGLQAPAVP